MDQSTDIRQPARLAIIDWLVGIALAVAVYFDLTGTSTITYVGSYNLTSTDAAIGVTSLALVWLAFTGPPKSGWLSVLLLAFVAIIGLNVIRGLTISPNAALIGLRTTALYCGFLVLAAYAPFNEITFGRIRAIVVIAGLSLGVLLVFRLTLGPTVFMLPDADSIEPGDEGRGLTARAALIIGLAATLQLSKLFELRRRRAPKALDAVILLLLLAGLLTTRQATATIASGVGLLLVFALERGPFRSVRLLALSFLVACVAAVLIVSPDITTRDGLQGLLPEFLIGNISARQINLGFRQDVWNGFMLDFPRWSMFDQLFGLPLGQKPLVVLQRWGGVYWNFGLHSQYFAAIANAGLIGLGLFVLTTVGSGIALATLSFRPADQGYDLSPLGAALCAICLVYGYGYDLNNDHGIIVLLVALAVRSRGAAVPVQSPLRRPDTLTT